MAVPSCSIARSSTGDRMRALLVPVASPVKKRALVQNLLHLLRFFHFSLLFLSTKILDARRYS